MHRVRVCVPAVALLWAAVGGAREPAPGTTASHPLLAAADAMPAHEVAPAFLAAMPMPSHPVADAVTGATPSSLQDAAMAALPPPPKKVVLETIYFGTVTVDHEAHLARRAPCKACHGPGPVHKIGRFVAKEAHDACRGCHQRLARGPTDCRGCHVVKPAAPAPAETAIAAQEAQPAAPAAGAPAASTSPPAVAAVSAPGATPRAITPGGGASVASVPGGATPAGALAASRLSTVELPDALAFRRCVLGGVSVVAGGGRGPAAGLSASVRMQQDGYVVSNTLEWSGQGERGRMLGLLGGGAVIPIRDRWAAHVLGVGGFDAFGASFLPTLGGRAGFEWIGGRAWVQSIDVALTTVADVGRARGPSGERLGGVVASFSVAAGMDLHSER